MLTPEELYERLPPARDFWFVPELAKAFGLNPRTIQYTLKRKKIGRKVRYNSRGTYVVLKEELPLLCQHVHGVRGNPKVIKMYKERMNARDDV